jgi:hypothetical protein
VDNPRLWTTADVRAALEALELAGRGPSVEELNGEGFPYSPYVLRRPELLAPAAMAATSATVGPAPAAPEVQAAAPPAPERPLPAPAADAPAPGAPVREQPSQAAIAQAVAASAAAAHAAAAQEAAPPVLPQRDTVAIDGPAPPDDGGIGGLFADADADPEPVQPVGTVVRPRTKEFPQTPPYAVPAPPPAFWSQGEQADDAGEGSPGHLRGRAPLMALAAVLVVAVLGVGGWLFLRDSGDSGGGADAVPSASETATPGPEVGDVHEVGGTEYTVQAVQVEDSCAGHAYGDTAAFFAGVDCTALSRALYSARIDGEPVVVSVVRVLMPHTAAARDLQALTDRNGSGNVNDLLREGVRYTGSPAELSGAEYASAVSGSAVTIVESAWVDEEADGGSAEIDRIADAGLALPVTPFPSG